MVFTLFYDHGCVPKPELLRLSVLVLRRIERALVRTSKLLSPTELAFRRAWSMIDGVEGFLISPRQERWLFGAARSLPSGANIVEIGSFKGRSTVALALGCGGSGKHVFAVDTFDGNEVDFLRRGFYDEFLMNIENCGVGKVVIPVKGKSRIVAAEWARPIHLLFIDGSHEYNDVIADFDDFYPHVVPGGLVAFHDVTPTWPDVLRVWEEHAKDRLVNIGRCHSLAYGFKPLEVS